MAEVPRTQPGGRPTTEAIGRELELAFRAEIGRAPRQGEMELFLAQVQMETAKGSALYRWNFGNITASDKWAGDYWRPTWYEEPGPSSSDRIRKLHAAMLAGKAPSKFRAYDSAAEGARDYFRILRTRFPSILEAASSGDVQAFAVAIRDSGYCPDCPPSATVKTLASLAGTARKGELFAGLGPEAPTTDPGAEALRWLLYLSAARRFFS